MLTGCSTPSSSPISALNAILVLDEMSSSIDDATASAEFAYNNSINNTSVQIKSIIGNLRYAIKDTADEIDDKITEQQFRLLENTITLKNEFDESLNNGFNRTENLTNSISQIVSDLPFTKNEPRITKTEIPLFVKDWSNNVKLNFQGYNLDYEDNFISIGDEITLKASTQNSTGIEFLISNKKISETINEILNENSSSTNYIKGEVHLFYKKGWVFGKKKEKILPITIKVIPRKIGTIKVVFQVDEYQSNIEHINASCAVGTPSPGWKGKRKTRSKSCPITAPRKLVESCNNVVQGSIIPTSIVSRQTAKRYGGGHSVGSITNEGFVLNVTAKSESKPGGGGGLYSARVEYDVEYPCKVKSDKSFEEMQLLVGQEIPIDLTGNKDPLYKRAEISFFDGSEMVLSSEERKHSLLEISNNDAKQQVIIRPVRISKN